MMKIQNLNNSVFFFFLLCCCCCCRFRYSLPVKRSFALFSRDRFTLFSSFVFRFSCEFFLFSSLVTLCHCKLFFSLSSCSGFFSFYSVKPQSETNLALLNPVDEMKPHWAIVIVNVLVLATSVCASIQKQQALRHSTVQTQASMSSAMKNNGQLKQNTILRTRKKHTQSDHLFNYW